MKNLTNIPIPIIKYTELLKENQYKNIENLLPLENYKCFYFDKSRRALPIIYSFVEKEINKKPKIILPAYICSELVKELDLINAKISFYDTFQNLKQNDLKDIDILLYINYFGNEEKIKPHLQKLIRKNNIWTIKDATHCSFNKKETKSDFIIYSPYKVFGTLNGGILLLNKKYKRIKNDIKSFHLNLRSDKLKIKTKSFLYYIYWLIKNKLYLLNLLNRLPEYDLKNKAVSQSESYISPSPSLKIINNLSTNIEYINQKRIYNKQSWDQLISLIFPLLKEKKNNSVPYLSVYRIKPNRINIHIILKFRKYGIPFSNWPNLPNEIKKNPIDYKSAINKKNTLIMLPCHQTLKSELIFKKGFIAFEKLLKFHKKNCCIISQKDKILIIDKITNKTLLELNIFQINNSYYYCKIILNEPKLNKNIFFKSNLFFLIYKNFNLNFPKRKCLIFLPSNKRIDNYYSELKKISPFRDEIFLNFQTIKFLLNDFVDDKKFIKQNLEFKMFESKFQILLKDNNKIIEFDIAFIDNNIKILKIVLNSNLLNKLVLIKALEYIKKVYIKKIIISNKILYQILRNMNYNKYFKLRPYILKK